jgi:ribosomal protein S18 acetylase RimI-like enzyme
MSRVEIVPASPAHVGVIANRMRQADVIECAAMGMTPKRSLRHSLCSSSEAWTAKVDGRPEAMFGIVVASALSGIGHPWMLGSEEIYRHPKQMMRGGRRFLSRWYDSTPDMSVLVARQNVRAIRFLRGCGFAAGREVIMFAGVEFMRLERIA